jgi:hypothetical protein
MSQPSIILAAKSMETTSKPLSGDITKYTAVVYEQERRTSCMPPLNNGGLHALNEEGGYMIMNNYMTYTTWQMRNAPDLDETVPVVRME